MDAGTVIIALGGFVTTLAAALLAPRVQAREARRAANEHRVATELTGVYREALMQVHAVQSWVEWKINPNHRADRDLPDLRLSDDVTTRIALFAPTLTVYAWESFVDAATELVCTYGEI